MRVAYGYVRVRACGTRLHALMQASVVRSTNLPTNSRAEIHQHTRNGTSSQTCSHSRHVRHSHVRSQTRTSSAAARMLCAPAHSGFA